MKGIFMVLFSSLHYGSQGLINNIAQVQHTAHTCVACAERGASSPSLVVT